MRAINHALTGAAIGILSGKPEVAIPIAFVSHYVCDVIPHYGEGLEGEKGLKTKNFKYLLILDPILCFVLVLVLFIAQPLHWLLAAICAFTAASPDFLSINYYLTVRSGKKYKPGPYVRFAKRIQWFEKPPGAIVEIAWLSAMIAIILPFFT